MRAEPFVLDGLDLTPEAVAAVADGATVRIADSARERVAAGAAALQRALESGQRIYGVTTGFGANASVGVPAGVLSQGGIDLLQRKLLWSHAVGTGPLLPVPVGRAMLVIRLNTLLRGHSGVGLACVDLLAALLNAGVSPEVPALGSVGASGDLAPLSHLALVLIGEGHARLTDGRRLPGAEALAAVGLSPLARLGPKEGLALNNGTALMAAWASLVVTGLQSLLRLANENAALALEALCGHADAVDAEVQQLRPHPGQLACAAAIRAAIAGSRLVDRPAAAVPWCRRDPRAPQGLAVGFDLGADGTRQGGKPDRPQDAYSLRCAPQVHGAVMDQLDHARRVVEIELNAVTDNPLLLGERVVSAGHFHGMPLALAMAGTKAAMAALASISERRLAKLLDPAQNHGLPAFLVPNPDGTDSGLMILQYTAAALVNELATRAMPAAVHSIPTCANTEDHVSMGANDARHAFESLTLLGEVLLLERLALLQALRLRLWSLAEWARNAGGDVPDPGPLARKVIAEAESAGVPLRWSDGLLLGDLERLRGVLGLSPGLA